MLDAIFRTTTGPAGWTFIPGGTRLRERMTELASRLTEAGGAHRVRLRPFLAARFDQHVSTRSHFDGGPYDSVLLLGYAPTTVVSVVTVFDPHRTAEAAGLSYDAWMDEHDPLLHGEPRGGERVPLEVGEGGILVLNNSRPGGRTRWLGVMHAATIRGGSGRRIVESLQLAALDEGDAGADLEAWRLTADVVVNRP